MNKCKIVVLDRLVTSFIQSSVEPACECKNSATSGPLSRDNIMSKTKVRAGHRGFLKGMLPDVDAC